MWPRPLTISQPRSQHVDLMLKGLSLRPYVIRLRGEFLETFFVHPKNKRRRQNGVEVRNKTVLDREVHYILCECSEGYLDSKRKWWNCISM